MGGFALSHFNLLGLAPSDQSDLAIAVESRLSEAEAAAEVDRAALSALRADLAPMGERLAALEAQPVAEPVDPARIDAVEDRLAAIEAVPTSGDASTAALAAKLADLEQRLAALPQGVDQAEVDAALARLAEAEAEASHQAEIAATAAAEAARADALDRLISAVRSGGDFAAELAALDDPELSEALAPYQAGIATQEGLQAEFPDLARQVLDLARQGSEAQGWGSRMIDFLAAQTEARSLTPREGNDPDAILSRAEFALSEERLADALDELQGLDPALRGPLDPWIARAEARMVVLTTLESR
jgi:hypothetical protein